MRHFIPFLLLGLILPGIAHGDIYKWVDSKGEVHYSDQPVPKADAKKLDVSPPPPTEGQAGASLADKEMAFRKRQVEREEAQKKQQEQQAEARQKQDNCQSARGNLRTLEAGGRIFSYNEKGDRVYLDDQARQKAIGKAQKEVETWCK